jgi:hypothetical protein
MSFTPTIQQFNNVERQVSDLCDASGLPHSALIHAEVVASKTTIRVNLVHGTYAWVLRFRYVEQGNPLINPTLQGVWLNDDNGQLIKVKLVNGNELPWGYN